MKKIIGSDNIIFYRFIQADYSKNNSLFSLIFNISRQENFSLLSIEKFLCENKKLVFNISKIILNTNKLILNINKTVTNTKKIQ